MFSGKLSEETLTEYRLMKAKKSYSGSKEMTDQF